jgi:formiminotetrahydrofolate cyclodeaminase
LDDAVAGAIGVPMRVLELAAEVAMLAADVAETGNRNLEGDALAGSLLAEAAARSAATLAQLNASMLSRHAIADAHLERLRPALAKATRARERAVSAYTHI